MNSVTMIQLETPDKFKKYFMKRTQEALKIVSYDLYALTKFG